MSDRRVSLKWYPNGTATLAGINKNTDDRKKVSATYKLNFEVRTLGSVKTQSRTVVDPEKAGLSFSDVCVDVSEKRILWSVGGNAKPGKILALMGPSGKLFEQWAFGQFSANIHHQSVVVTTVCRFGKDYSSQLFSWLHSTQFRLHYSTWSSNEQESSSSD